jgi:hypothetical protein
MRKRIVRGRLSHSKADRPLGHMTGEPIITPIRTYIALYPIRLLPYLRTACAPDTRL